VCDVTRLQSVASFSGVVTTVSVRAVGVDEVVVVREACDVAVYPKLCAISSSPSYQVKLTGERTTSCRHAAPVAWSYSRCLQVEGSENGYQGKHQLERRNLKIDLGLSGHRTFRRWRRQRNLQ
jgi:hypothetical protein